MNLNNGRMYECYKIQISNKYDDFKIIYQLMYNVYRVMKRVYESSEKFADIAFIVGISNTSSSDACVNIVRSGKRGHPKRVILGTKESWHFHIYVFCENGIMLSSFCNKVKNRLKKSKEHYNSIEVRGHKNPRKAISYFERQCYKRLTYNDYLKFQKLHNENTTN